MHKRPNTNLTTTTGDHRRRNVLHVGVPHLLNFWCCTRRDGVMRRFVLVLFGGAFVSLSGLCSNGLAVCGKITSNILIFLSISLYHTANVLWWRLAWNEVHPGIFFLHPRANLLGPRMWLWLLRSREFRRGRGTIFQMLKLSVIYFYIPYCSGLTPWTWLMTRAHV